MVFVMLYDCLYDAQTPCGYTTCVFDKCKYYNKIINEGDVIRAFKRLLQGIDNPQKIVDFNPLISHMEALDMLHTYEVYNENT